MATPESQLELTQKDQEYILDDESQNQERIESSLQIWATLVSLNPMIPHKSLYNSPPDERGRSNLCKIGRSPKCDLSFENKRISNIHCEIFCRKTLDESSSRFYLTVYLENCSTNGTFIKRSNIYTKLNTKGDTNYLENGDEICLINPYKPKAGRPRIPQNNDLSNDTNDVTTSGSDAIYEREVRLASFLIKIVPQPDYPSTYHFSPMTTINETGPQHALLFPNNLETTKKQDDHSDMKYGSNGDASTSTLGLRRSNTILRSLNKKRNINDYYFLRHKLGDGAGGQVVYSTEKSTSHPYAIKIIDTKALRLRANRSPNTRNSAGGSGLDFALFFPPELLREAEIIRSLRHPNIITLYDVFSDLDGNKLYFVMELMSGGDLFDRVVAKQKYPEKEAVQVMCQLLDAVAYIHNKGIAHRDIKPENILLTSRASDVDVKLTDFGLAKHLNDGLMTFCGTPQYLAPEVLRQKGMSGLSVYSVEADMWSLGVVLYVLLSGTLPWHDSTIIQQIETASYDFTTYPTLWEDVSATAKDLISHLLVLDANQRMKANQALRHPWFHTHNLNLHLHGIHETSEGEIQRQTSDMSVITTNADSSSTSSSETRFSSNVEEQNEVENIDNEAERAVTMEQSLLPVDAIVVSESQSIGHHHHHQQQQLLVLSSTTLTQNSPMDISNSIHPDHNVLIESEVVINSANIHDTPGQYMDVSDSLPVIDEEVVVLPKNGEEFDNVLKTSENITPCVVNRSDRSYKVTPVRDPNARITRSATKKETKQSTMDSFVTKKRKENDKLQDVHNIYNNDDDNNNNNSHKRIRILRK